MKKMIVIMSFLLGPLAAAEAWEKPTLEGEVTSEWQWSPNKKRVNWMNMLRLDAGWSPWKGGRLEVATLHMAKTYTGEESIVGDYQVFSNIQEENCYAAIAVMGVRQEWPHAVVFVGVRNMNEDYFTSPVTSFFTNSSPGIFPTISANYPLANYPVSSMGVHVELSYGGWHVKNSVYNGAAYNGWKRGDNPFLVRPRRDGVLEVVEVSYDNGKSFYSVGSMFHERVFDEEMQPWHKADGSGYERRGSMGWWLYGEQCLWEREDVGRKVSLMAQYSENTRGMSYLEEVGGCKRYAELGCLYDFGANHVGVTAQYAHYGMGREESVEVTYSREVKEGLSLQPVVNYIHNDERRGDYVVVSGRLVYSF